MRLFAEKKSCKKTFFNMGSRLRPFVARAGSEGYDFLGYSTHEPTTNASASHEAWPALRTFVYRSSARSRLAAASA